MSVFPKEVQKAIDAVGPGVDHAVHKVERETVWWVASDWLVRYDLAHAVLVTQDAFGLSVRGYGTVAQALGYARFLEKRCPSNALQAKIEALEQVFAVLDAARMIPGTRLLY